MIGLMGAISFVSFSVGSLTFTDIVDKKGRKLVVLMATMVTPLGIIALMLFADNIWHIYTILFIVGLTYNPRGSVAYLYGSEFLDKESRLRFGIINFVISGLLCAFSALWFYVTKDQNLYFAIMIALLLIAMFWVAIAVPESP